MQAVVVVFHLLILCGLLMSACPSLAQPRFLNVYNWTDYIDPAVVEWFERDMGVTVRYDVYDSLETLEAKLLVGHSGYDVVVPTSEPTLSRLIKLGALQPIDRAEVPNWSNLDTALMHLIEMSDPGNRYGAIYLWGSIGLGMLPDRLRRLAPDAPIASWDLLFKPDNARRLAPCGITMMDSAVDVIPSVLHYLGRRADSPDPADLAAVERTLMGIRPFIRRFANGGALEALAAGETCLVFDYSGDVIQAAARAEEAKRGVAVRYVAPKEGAQLAFDVLAIPADAPHPDLAVQFINFLLRPDVMAAITNKVRYANAVPASKPMINPEIASNTDIFPTPAQMATFFTIGPIPQAAERARTRMWARFKAGH